MIGYTIPNYGKILTLHDWLKYEKTFTDDVSYVKDTLGYQLAVARKELRLARKAFLIECIPIVRWYFKKKWRM